MDNFRTVRKDSSMNRIGLTTSSVIFLFSVAGCATGAYNPASLEKQAAGSGYCHKKLQPIGPTDPAKVNRSAGDYIDYYGPCDGPTIAEQTRDQRRFERFRFGRDYMDEG
jgi:hypothetical protein